LLRLILKVVQEDGSVDVTLPVYVKTLLKSSEPEEGYRKFLVNGRVQYRKTIDIPQTLKAKTIDEVKDWFYKDKKLALKFIEDEFKSDEEPELEVE